MSEHQLKAAMSSPVKPPLPKEEDPRDRAARRAAEIMKHLDNEGFEGTRDRFYFPIDDVPNGWVYEWKRFSVYNLEDPHYVSSLQRLGWDFVPAERHPEMMPMGTSGHIVRDGMVLMERPETIQKLATDREKKLARDQVRVKEQALAAKASPNEFDRENKGQPLVRVRKNWEPVEIPD